MQTMQNPFVLVIFGATGDLAQKKLFPALFSLYKKKQLPEQFHIVGFSRREWSDDAFRDFLTQVMSFGDAAFKEFLTHISYQYGTFEQIDGYNKLITRLHTFDEEVGASLTRIFYLATPPDNYLPILDNLQTTKLSEGLGQGSFAWTRIAIEKPFGKDLITAKMLDQRLAAFFEEQQIFRVDHYLGKETVQNILAFRFANGIFEPVWNQEFIDHVQITWMEAEGIGKRGHFFDGVGILRDVGQNHLMQLLATVAMEQPKSFSKEAVRDVRAHAIGAIEQIAPEKVVTSVVRGQYQTYTEEENITQDSKTETYVAMKLYLNTPRFKGVPFYIRAGKKMPKEMMEISIVFKQTCHILFKEAGCPEIGNVLTFRIQPDEGIHLRVIAKTPGTTLALETIDMKFQYKEHAEHQLVDAYEKILLDILSGDQMLFNRSDELASSWEFITNILAGWQLPNVPIFNYEDKTEGPKEADALIAKDGRKWLA